MKCLLSFLGMLTLAVLPANAGVHVSGSFGGGSFHGTFSVGGGYSGGRCGYSSNCYGHYRSCGYSYPCYGYGYYYGGYSPYIYSTGYDYSYMPAYDTIPVPIPQSVPPPQAPPPVATPPAPTSMPPPAPLEFGVLDVNGYVHSPYSDAIFKVPNVRNAQMVYDPVTGKAFLVH